MDKVAKQLFSIVKKQQETITKLAQMVQDQEIKQYLDTALTTAVANSGVSSSYHSSLNKNPGQLSADGLSSEDSYVLNVSFNPALTDNNLKQKLLNNFKNFIKANRPELDGRVGLIFG